MTLSDLVWAERSNGRAKILTAPVGAYALMLVEDWGYSACNGQRYFHPSIALRIAKDRPLLVVWSGAGTPKPADEARSAAWAQLPVQAARVRAAFAGMLPGVNLEMPGDVTAASTPIPLAPGRGAFLEID